MNSRICLGQICLLLLQTQEVHPPPRPRPRTFPMPFINASSAAEERMAKGNRDRLGCPAEGPAWAVVLWELLGSVDRGGAPTPSPYLSRVLPSLLD